MSNTMNTGDVSRRLGVPVTVPLLESLGFTSVGKDKRASLWDQADYPEMARKVGKYVADRANVPMQDKPPKKSVSAPVDDDPDAL
jgi:hypothetical protein